MAESALHRYFHSADLMRAHFEATPTDSPESALESRIYMGRWYAGLYTVIEGWRALRLDDDKVEEALVLSNVDLLSVFRSNVYHFQHDYDAERARYLAEGANIVPWARELTNSLRRWFEEAAKN